MSKKYTPSNKFVLVIPFWEGDRHQAIALSHLLADIQPGHSDDMDLLFCARFDCPQVDAATIKHVSRKFNVLTYTSKRRGTGWPMGCSDLFFGSMEFLYHKMTANQLPGYRFIFQCEADTIPLTRDCFSYLLREWSRISSKQPLSVAGALVNDGGRAHVNGGACLITGQMGFLKWLVKTVGGVKQPVGWDFCYAEDFRARGWSNINGIRSFWNTPTMTRAEAEHHARAGTVWLHGVKDFSLLQHARAMLVA